MYVNMVVLGGTVATEPVERGLPSGDRIVELRVFVTDPEDRTLPLPVVVKRHNEIEGFVIPKKGDEVVVKGKLVRRFYRSGAGARSLTEVVASEMTNFGGGDHEV